MIYIIMTLICWGLVWMYWVVMAWGNKKTVYRQSYVRRAVNSAAIIASYTLVYIPPLPLGILRLRLLPEFSAIQIFGVICCAAGAATAIWARRTIGRNWSGIVTLKEDHELIQRGPYRLVRHPIYTGLLLAMLGSAIVLGEVRGLVAFLLMAFAFLSKMGEEEALMNKQFPEQYPSYQARVKRLVPFLY